MGRAAPHRDVTGYPNAMRDPLRNLAARLALILALLVSGFSAAAYGQAPGGGVVRPNIGPGQGPRAPYTEIEWRYWWWLNMEPLIDLRARLGMDGRHPRLGNVDLQQIIDALREAGQSSDPAMRSAAFLALGKTGAEGAKAPLLLGLEDSAVLSRRSAIFGLGVLGDPSALSMLDQIVRSESWETRERATAAVALGLLEGDSTPPIDAVSVLRDDPTVWLGGSDGSVTRYDVLTGEALDPLVEGGAAIRSLARIDDQAAVGRDDGTILLIDQGKRGQTQSMVVSKSGAAVVSLAFRPGSRTKLAAIAGDRLYLVDPRNARELGEYRLGLGDGPIAWASEDSKAGLLAAAAGSAVAILNGDHADEHGRVDLLDRVTALIADASGNWLAGTSKGAIHRILTDGTSEPLVAEGPAVAGLALLDDGTRLAILTAGGAVRLMHAVTGAAVASLPGVPVDAVAFLAGTDDSLLVLATDRILRRIDARPSTGGERWVAGPSRVTALDLSPRLDHLLVGREDGTSTVSSTRSGADISAAGDPEGGRVTAVRFDPRGDKAAVARGPALEIWRVRDGKLLQAPLGARSDILCLVFLKGGEQIAAGCEDGVTLIWWADSGKEVARFSAVGAVTDLLSSPADDDLLVTTDARGEPALWSARDRVRLGYLAGAGGATALAAAPDGEFVMATTPDGAIHGYRMTTGSSPTIIPLGIVGELGGAARDLAWSPTDNNLVAVLEDGRVVILDADTGAALSVVEDQPATAVAFVRDGTGFALAGEDGAVTVMSTRDALSAVRLRGRSAGAALGSLLEDRVFSKLPIAVKGAVALGAGLSRDPSLVSPMKERLTQRKSEPSLVRTYLATGLGGLDDEVAVDLLITLVKDKDTQVRRAAAMAIGALLEGSGNKDALSALARQEDKESELLARCLQGIALARIGGTSATRLLAENLFDKPLSGIPGVIGPPRISFGAFGREPYAALGLGLIGHKNASPLLAQRLERVNDQSLRAALSIALGLLCDARAAPAIEEVLRHTADPSLRSYLCIALGLVGAKGSIPDLERFLAEENDLELIPGAAIGLAMLDRSRVTPLIVGRLRQETNAETQRVLLYALGQVGDGVAAATALEMLTDTRIPTHVRVQAAQALGELADPKLHPPLWRLRANFNFTVETEHLMPPGGWMTER